ncbi:MAG: class I adenylate-forming enzyme family protein [Actinomycetota bacterium]|nr:class I adenylate-forming enzyme family protein [Actinomycetota bacterium]
MLSDSSFDAVSAMSAAELFDRRVQETSGSTAIRTIRGEMTFGEWRKRAWSIRGLLTERFGTLTGERVVLWMTNDEALVYASAFQAVIDAAAISVALDDRLAITEARRVMREAEPRALLLTPLVAQRLGEDGLSALGAAHLDPSRPGVDMYALAVAGDACAGEPVSWALSDVLDPPAPIGARPDHEVMIAYTSGSTGTPKGALWTQSALCQYAERVSNAIYSDPRGGRPLRSNDVVQSPIPLYTAASIIENLYPTIFAGCTLVYEGRRFDALASETRMHEHGTTVYNGVPPHYALMCELPRPQLPAAPEVMVTSGSAFTGELYRRMRERWPKTAIANWYGLNESGTGQTLNHGADMERCPSSIGRPIWPTEVKIVDAEFEPVAQGSDGELWMRAPGQMSGYFRNPEQTAQRLHEGWLRTGDRAMIDADGLILVIGRAEERINRGGFKFYPGEIEAVLEEHPAVREAAVVAVPHSVLGDDPVAFVVAIGDVDEEALRAHCRRHIAANKIPSRVLLVDELPRGAYGKIVRREVLKRYGALLGAEPTNERPRS